MNPLHFDIRTILGMLILGNLASAMLLFIYKNKFTSSRGLVIFVVSKALQMLAYLLLGLRGVVSYTLSAGVGNVALITGIALELLALTTARRESRRWEVTYALLAVLGLTLFFTAAHASNTRIGTISLVRLALFATAGTAILADAAGSPIRRAIGLLYLAFCVPLVLRAYLAFQAPATFTLFDAGWANVAMYTASCFILFVNGIAFLLMHKEVEDERLAESEDRYRTLVETASESILILQDGRVAFGNEPLARLLGLPREALAGEDLFAYIHPEDRASVLRCHMMRLEGQDPGNGYDFRFLVAGGRVSWVTLYATRMNWKGRPAIQCLMTDITARKELELEREQAIADLQKALSEITVLGGLLPICSSCKKIRDDRGYWNQIEAYIASHSQAQFTHGICPECARSVLTEFHNAQDSARN